MNETAPIIHSVTEGGIAAEHIPLPAAQALVAATHTTKEHNTIKTALVPFACWRAHDMRFKFDSSFVLPDIKDEIKALKELIDKHTLKEETGEPKHKPALTVFGHADPVGSDDYNKTLSGKRAQAIYGMLVRNVDLWDNLYQHPQGNDKWEPEVIHAMQSELNQPLSGKPSVSVRKALYKAYMDRVCTIRDDNDQPILDDKGQPVRLELAPADFLAGGADKEGGKGDYQGCGEFNPVLLFSQKKNQDFSKPEKKETRDQENAVNRRVLIFLFRPGVRINPQNWPCPRAKEGVEGCKKRFWSDGEKRRTNRLPDKPRKFEETKDTFACRFYDRLSANSPCERTLEQFRIRLFDPTGRPLPGAPFRIQVAGRSIPGQANRDGDAMVQHLTVPATCNVFWSRPHDEAPPPKEPTDFQFFKVIHVLIEDLDKNEKTGADHPDDASVKRLQNLGYTRHPDLAENVRDFQEDLGLSGDKLTGKIADVRDELRNRHDSLNPPRRTPRTGA